MIKMEFRMKYMAKCAAGIGALTLVAGCAGAQSGSQIVRTNGATPLSTFGTSTSTLATARSAGFAVRPDRGAPWALPGAKSQQLLYVSDPGSNDVYMYAYPSLKLAGTLTGFSEPQGECTDSKANVWIANTAKHEIVEYAHAGTKRLKTLKDPSGWPLSCAIAPTSGNLAVTNIYDLSGAGTVLIYAGASGTPKSYSNPSQYYYYFDGYDSKGNLYVGGRDPNGNYILSVLPNGGSTMSTVGLSGGTIYFPGTVEWVGKSLVLGDQICGNTASSCLYETSVSGSTATISGTTSLGGSCDVVQASIISGTVAGGDFEYCYYSKSGVDTWPYPAGGSHTKSVGGVRVPIGLTLSK
jgi:hypothetical protein